MCGPRDIEIMGYREQIGPIRFDKGLCHFWLNLQSLKKKALLRIIALPEAMK